MFGNNSPSLEEYFKGLNSNFLTKRTIISLLVVGIGILSIPIAVDLVQTQQNPNSRAAAPTADQVRQCQEQIASERGGIPLVPEVCHNENADDDLNSHACTWAGWKSYEEMKASMRQQGWSGNYDDNCAVLAAFNGQKSVVGECRTRVQEEYKRTEDQASRDPLVQTKTLAIGRSFKVKAVDDAKLRDIGGVTYTVTTPGQNSLPLNQNELYTPSHLGTYKLVVSGGEKKEQRCLEDGIVNVSAQCASSCAQCIVNSKGPVFLAQLNADTSIPGTCEKYDELVNIWCSRTDPGNCQTQKATTCATACSAAVNNAQTVPANPNPDQVTVTCSTDNSKVTVNWPTAAGAMGYGVRIDDKTKGGWTACNESQGDYCKDIPIWNTNFQTTEIPVTAGDDYDLWVHGFNSKGLSDNPTHIPFRCPGGKGAAAPENPSPTGSGGGQTTSPSDPTNLRYICMGNNQAKLTWNYVPNVASYIVRVGSQSYDVSNTASELVTPSKDVTAQSGQSYSWSVQAGGSQAVSGTPISCR